MRGPAFALALLAGLLATTSQQASTANNVIPESTAVYRGTTVTGAELLSIDYTMVSGSISAVKPKLRGQGLLAGTLSNLVPKTVTAQFGADAPVACVLTASTLLDSLTGAADATYDCAGTAESAKRPARLLIKVS